MTAFIIAHSTVKNPEKFQTYARAVGPTLAPFGGEVALKGKRTELFAGDHDHQTVGVLKFPDSAAASAWYNSADYQALIENRDAAADMVIISYDEPPS